MRYSLRPYQQRAIDDVRREIMRGRKSPLIVAPTGAGKTVIASHMIEQAATQGRRTLFLAHRSELITQCSEKLTENQVRHGIIKAGIDALDRSALVQVASVQTYQRRQKFLAHHYDLIITDECHHAVANTYQEIYRLNGNPICIGLTATPYRTDGKGLGDIFDSMITVAQVADLIRDGFLVPPRLFRGQQKINLDYLGMMAGDYDQEQLSAEMKRPRLIGHAVSEYQRIAYGRRAVAFCVNVEHSKAVAQSFCDAGIPAEHLDGTTPAGEREAILNRLSTGRTLIVCNCGVLTEGWDEPKIEVVIALRPTKSRCLWRQMCGRGLRLSPSTGKLYCLILDHADWTKEHGYITDPDICKLDSGLSKERPAALITCKACGATLASRPALCPACGAPLSSPKQDDFAGADLGDAGFELVEDGSIPFAAQHANRPTAAQPLYRPAMPQQARIIRRSRGL